MKLVISFLGLLIFSVSAKMPGLDIYVDDLLLRDNQLKVSHLKPITNRSEYDNQP